MNAGGDLMAGSANTMGTMTFYNGLKFIQGANSPTWTLKIDGIGNSDCLDFGQQSNSPTGTTSTLSLTGTAALVITGTPLPSTTTPYTIITDLPATNSNGDSPLNLNDLVVHGPAGLHWGPLPDLWLL